MMNTVNLIGRTTKDIDLRYSQKGTAVGNFTLAVQRRFNKDEADFIRCVIFQKGAEILAEHVKKGHQIGVEGTIQTGSYNDKDGKKVFTTEVIVNNFTFLEPKGQNQNETFSAPGNAPKDATPLDINESDLPF